MANFVLADEINRAPAKVQSALLEVMAERHVTIGGTRYRRAEAVPRARDAEPDRVRGRVPAAGGAARPLPDEDQRRLPDRGRGARDRLPDGRRAASRPTRSSRPTNSSGCSRPRRRVFVHHAIVDYVVRLVLATRHPGEHGMPDVAQWVSYGASPRASLGLIAAGRAHRAAARPRLRAAAGRPRHRRRRARAPLVLSYDAIADGVPGRARHPPRAADHPAAAGGPAAARRRARPVPAGSAADQQPPVYGQPAPQQPPGGAAA